MQCNAMQCSLLGLLLAAGVHQNVCNGTISERLMAEKSLGKSGRFRTSGSTFSLRSTRLQFDHFWIRWYTKVCIRVRARTRIFIFVKKRRDFHKNKWKFGHVYGREADLGQICTFRASRKSKKKYLGKRSCRKSWQLRFPCKWKWLCHQLYHQLSQ